MTLLRTPPGTSSLDRLNIPTGARGQQLRAGQLSAQLSGQLAELAAALANYHTYCEQRLHALSSHGLSAVRAKVGLSGEFITMSGGCRWMESA